jgi:hypothetical protein
MAKELFHTFQVGEDNKDIQIERMTAGNVLSFMFKAMQIYTKGGAIDKLIENDLLKGLIINNQPNLTKDGNSQIDDLELYEYIDLLFEAVEFQMDFESLGKSKALKRMGLDIQGAKDKMQEMIVATSNEKQEDS